MFRRRPKCHKYNWGETWILNGKQHREDGPAFTWHGDKEWWVKGKRHRIDGPAIEYKNGYQMWYLHDKNLSKEKYFKELEKLKSKNYANKIRLIYA